LRIPQLLIGVSFSGYRSANPRFAPAIYRSASPSDHACDSRRLPTSGSAFQLNCPTLIGCQILQLALQPISSLRLQPAFPLNLLAYPSTCVFVSALRTAFRFNLRLAPPAVPPAHRPLRLQALASQLFVRLRLPSGLQLAPSTSPPALPSNLTSDSSVAASFGFALVPSFGLRLQSTFRLCFPASFQLAPSANLPALPSNLPAACAACCSGLRLRADFQLAPSIDRPARQSRLSPACAFDLALRLRFLVRLQLAPPASRPALPSDPTSDSHRMSYSPVGLWSVSSLRLQPTLCAQPSGLVFDSRLRLCPQARLSINLATRAACQPPAHLRTSLQLAPSFCRPAPLSF